VQCLEVWCLGRSRLEERPEVRESSGFTLSCPRMGQSPITANAMPPRHIPPCVAFARRLTLAGNTCVYMNQESAPISHPPPNSPGRYWTQRGYLLQSGRRGCPLSVIAIARSSHLLGVRRTPGISCEAVPASDRDGAGMRRHFTNAMRAYRVTVPPKASSASSPCSAAPR